MNHKPIQNELISFMLRQSGPKPINQQGFTLLETLIALTIAAMLIVTISGVVNTALTAQLVTKAQHDNLQQARFAMERMVNAVQQSKMLMLPLNENATTAWSESVRNVLAVSLEITLDNNKDGWADANNDMDFLDINNNGSRDTGEPERIDEDVNKDNTNDAASGIIGIDDDGDGLIDESSATDNDEDGQQNEDIINGLDDDADGSTDEDLDQDMTGDGKAGISGIDDDFDSQIDENPVNDDDEDNITGEDWLDPHVFYLNGTTLMERLPTILPANGASYTEYVIAENVSQFRVERIIPGNVTSVLVDITLTIAPAEGAPLTLNTHVVVSGRL
ncbi:MAG: prepilin-type N-terminal cleavage/methylation domain-containing protein [Methylobacter sp.]|nr:prepilin-type N-terminal cleavage/methylation domain-containing protein [Methylobacter sp.]